MQAEEHKKEIIIVDDVLSTGGTLKAVLKSLKKIGVIVKCIIIAIDKGDSAKEITNENNIDVYTLANIIVKEGKIIIRKI